MVKPQSNLPARSRPVFIAHRGAASEYPENTVLAVEQALQAGVDHIEIDVQLSADRVPMLSHDDSLWRTAGVDRLVSATTASELTSIGVGQRDRFGDRFATVRMATLATLLQRLDSVGPVHLFVELKRDALRAFGRRRVVDSMVPVLWECRHQVTLISFDATVLIYARDAGSWPVGWVLSDYTNDSETRARELAPEFLFCNHLRLPRAGPLWAGPWEWAVYEITNLAHARTLALQGVDYIESMDAPALLRAASGS